MHILCLSSLVSALVFTRMTHAVPCELNAPYAKLEIGCKYAPEVCRGLDERLFAVRHWSRLILVILLTRGRFSDVYMHSLSSRTSYATLLAKIDEHRATPYHLKAAVWRELCERLFCFSPGSWMLTGSELSAPTSRLGAERNREACVNQAAKLHLRTQIEVGRSPA
ncbi:hypothetical protein DFH06DRAFT_1133835 [Mycena polygramma]|nr:hypothetical protein DFH06DRAFT_1133835 [Mycena polygramma]